MQKYSRILQILCVFIFSFVISGSGLTTHLPQSNLEKNSPAYLDSLGLALLWKGEFDESASIFQRALEIDPNLNSAIAGLLSAYILMNNTENALNLAQDYYHHTGKSTEDTIAALIWIAGIHFIDDQAEKGKAVLMECVELSEKSASLNDLQWAGMMLRDAGEYKLADEVQQKRLSVAMQSDISDSMKSVVHQNVLWDRAYYAMMSGDLNTAYTFRDEFLNLGLENPEETVPFQKMRAMLAIYERQYDKAIDYFKQFQGITAKYRLALAYRAKGETNEAERLYKEISQTYSRSILNLVVRNKIIEVLENQYTRKP